MGVANGRPAQVTLRWLAISDQEGIDVWAAMARSDARSARST